MEAKTMMLNVYISQHVVEEIQSSSSHLQLFGYVIDESNCVISKTSSDNGLKLIAQVIHTKSDKHDGLFSIQPNGVNKSAIDDFVFFDFNNVYHSFHIFLYDSNFIEYRTNDTKWFLEHAYLSKPALPVTVIQAMKESHVNCKGPRKPTQISIVIYLLLAYRLLIRLLARVVSVFSFKVSSNDDKNGSLFYFIWPMNKLKKQLKIRKQQLSSSPSSALMLTLLIDSILAFIILRLWGDLISIKIIIEWCISFNKQIATFITWLMESGGARASPLGIKLNLQLDITLGNMILAGLDWWSDVCSLLYTFTTHITTSITSQLLLSPSVIAAGKIFLSTLGLSFLFSVVCDVFGFVTLHISLFYLMSARIYQIQLNILIALWRLFRGQKRNVLRNNRIDSFAIYTTTRSDKEEVVRHGGISMDQMILGSLVFIIFAILFPTLAVFYFTLTVIKLSANIVYLLLALFQVFCLYTPWYSILLQIYCEKICRMQSFDRVNINLKSVKSYSDKIATTNIFFNLKGNRASGFWMNTVFAELREQITQLLSPLLSLAVFKGIFTGDRLPRL